MLQRESRELQGVSAAHLCEETPYSFFGTGKIGQGGSFKHIPKTKKIPQIVYYS